MTNQSTFKSLDNANGTLLDNDVFDGTSKTEAILGYWVYIPRYAYEVMRPNAVDRVVNDALAKEEGGFKINFETVNDTKKIPLDSCNLNITTAAQMWVNVRQSAVLAQLMLIS